MRIYFLLFLLWISAPVVAQVNTGEPHNRTRARTIDYTEFDKLMQGLYFAPDKGKAIDELLKITNTFFTPADEEFFQTHNFIGGLYEQQLIDPSNAMLHYQLAVDAYEKDFPFYHRGYTSVTAETAVYAYLSLSRVYGKLNLHEKAVKLLETNQKTIEENLSPALRQEFYREYAQSLLGAGQSDKAIGVALRLKDLTESGALAMQITPADQIYRINANDPPQVQEHMKKAREIYEQAMKKSQDALLESKRQIYNSVLANAYYNQFQFAESIPYAQRWLTATRKMMETSIQAFKDSQTQNPGINLSESIQFTSSVQEIGGMSTSLIIAAIKTNQPALASQYAWGIMDKAIYYQLNKDYNQAEQLYQRAFSAMNDLSKFSFSGSTGEQLRNAFIGPYVNLQVQAEKFDVALAESEKLIEREEQVLTKSFQFFSEGEKKEFFKAYNQKLERYFSLLLLMTEKNNDHADEILNKLLQTKGLILDVSREQEKRLKRTKDKTIILQIREIRKLRDKLAAFYQLHVKNPTPALADSVNKYSVKINDLERKVNEIIGATDDVLKPVSWKEVQGKLKEDEVYLEIFRLKRDYFSFDKPVVQYWAFAFKPGDVKPTLFKLSEGEAFDGRSLKNYQNRIRSQLEDTESYATYWAMVGEKIHGQNKIYFSSDGVYHMINPLTFKNVKTGNYLIDEIQLKRLSAGRDLLKSEVENPVVAGKIALIGNPDFNMKRRGLSNLYKGKETDIFQAADLTTRSGFVQLPGTQKELETILAMAATRGVKSDVLSGINATESKVKGLTSPRILHIATHGEFDQTAAADSYLKSKLILAGAADIESFTIEDYALYEDGFLTAYEVTQLEVEQTELVVLSACETGLGEIQSGEGVWGLQRAFQVAGARTVMGSLWKISDEATVIFMQTFYKKYFETTDVNTAYGEAMKATMLAYPHPYFWGAFILTGSGVRSK